MLRSRSAATHREITARLDPPRRNPRARILLRIRHPGQKPILSVTVDGKDHRDFDAAEK